MAVKDLVGHYESASPISSRSATPMVDRSGERRRSAAHATQTGTPANSSQPEIDSSHDFRMPPPRPARFIKHPLLQDADPPVALTNDATTSEQFASNIPTRSAGVTQYSMDERPEDVASSRSNRTAVPPPRGSRSRDNCTRPRREDSQVSEYDSLLPFSRDYGPRGSQYIPLAKIDLSLRTELNTDPRRESVEAVDTPRPSSSTATLVPHSPSSVHSSIPATTVFSRNAPPLFLPALDNYLASLPPPTFTKYPSASPVNYKGKGKEPAVPMFPPMDGLAASGKSIDDLETNYEIPPAWRNRDTIFGTLVDSFISITGSSMIATYYSLEGLVDTVQIFALILSTVVPHSQMNLLNSWQKLFLGTIPNILALNFASTFNFSLLFLLLFMAIAALLLYYFHVSTSQINPHDVIEGLQHSNTGTGWGLLLVSFTLTVLYLPLSTIAVHALVWSDDFWVVPNPYVNATSNPPEVHPLGPPSQFRAPLDFCYTTTMKLTEVNLAPLVVIISACVFAFMTVWYPIRLREVIQGSVPIVDLYTELGKRRTESDLNREYQRLLDRDKSAVSFLYCDFRRGWGTYKSTYLLAKLSALLIVAIIDPDNCLFRTLPRAEVAIIRQAVLIAAMFTFLLLQCFLAPFLNPINNASEVTSRINYLLTAVIGLGVAANIPGQSILEGPLLYTVYGITYGLSAYFTIMNWGWMRVVVKKLTRRIDFSLDIFSPRLDVSRSSPHTKRRIWQEVITTLFLVNPECKIPDAQPMLYAQARDSEYPPYLLDFQGTPAERHVENLKVLREVGLLLFSRAVALSSGPDSHWHRYLQDSIQRHFLGPDCYWKSPSEQNKPGFSKYFGNAWWIPFPPTVAMRYDDGPLVVLQEVAELELYMAQNQSDEIQKKKHIRSALRALDGQIVRWPYEHKQLVGAREQLCCGQRYKANSTLQFYACVLHIKRRGNLCWRGLQLGSGFDVELTYSKNVQVDGSVIGLTDDYNLTPSLARFLSMNHQLIPERLRHINAILVDYRDYYRRQSRSKASVLSYGFMTQVYERPWPPDQLARLVAETERDLRVRELIVGSEIALDATYERLTVATSSEVATWWYIYWDDFWRRNSNAISPLQLHASDFDPRYPTSIAYSPLPRSVLEVFLIQRGLMSKTPKWTDWVYSGLLNKMYFRMNDIVFHGSKNALFIHIGDGVSEADLEDIDLVTQGRPSTLGTGGGDDHEDSAIRPRPAYRWESLLDDPLQKGVASHTRWLGKLGVWFGITPVWRTGIPSAGVSLDVRLENGRFVLPDTGNTRTEIFKRDSLFKPK